MNFKINKQGMSPYYISYFREKDLKNSVRYSSTIYMYTVQNFSIAISATLAGALKSKYHFTAKKMAIVGSTILG